MVFPGSSRFSIIRFTIYKSQLLVLWPEKEMHNNTTSLGKPVHNLFVLQISSEKQSCRSSMRKDFLSNLRHDGVTYEKKTRNSCVNGWLFAATKWNNYILSGLKDAEQFKIVSYKAFLFDHGWRPISLKINEAIINRFSLQVKKNYYVGRHMNIISWRILLDARHFILFQPDSGCKQLI